MTRKNLGPKVDRRSFLTGVAVAGAAGTLAPQAANATTAAGAASARLPSALPPTAQQIAAETGNPQVENESNWRRRRLRLHGRCH